MPSLQARANEGEGEANERKKCEMRNGRKEGLIATLFRGRKGGMTVVERMAEMDEAAVIAYIPDRSCASLGTVDVDPSLVRSRVSRSRVLASAASLEIS